MKAETQMIAVPFHTDTVWATERNGDVLVAVKPICESLGLAWNGQHKRLTTTAVLAKGISVMEIPSPGGPQKTVCLPLKLLPGWLFGVDAKRVRPEIRAKIERYQAECYEVLWNYFRGQAPDPTPERPKPSARLYAVVESSLHQHQLRVLAAIKAYGVAGMDYVAEAAGLSMATVKRSVYLLWSLGLLETYQDKHGVMRVRVVPAEKWVGTAGK